MIKILFVCLGNICRSPTAHAVMQSKIIEQGLDDSVLVDSAGTSNWHVGKKPDSRSIDFASKRGYDLNSLRARQVTKDDFNHFEYVLAMDNNNLRDLRDMTADVARAKPMLFLQEFSQEFDELEVPDPYYGGDLGFDHVLDLIEDACDGLIAHIKRRLSKCE